MSMKKSLLFIFGATLFASADLLAQPTLTASGSNMVVGDVFIWTTSNAVAQGNAGANQTWNLSSLSSSGTATNTAVTPGSTPYGSSFPSANVSIQAGGGTYTYYTTSASAFQYRGIAPSASIETNYSNPEDYMHYPFTYNDTYTDYFVGVTTNTASPYPNYRRGSTTVTADGYGTLTTPVGTFGGVLRVHFVQNYQDSSNVAGTDYITTYANDQYMWYLNGNHTSIASTFTLVTTFFGSPTTTSGAQYLNSVIVGVSENKDPGVAMAVYPNPATTSATIKVKLENNSAIEIKTLNSLGAQVLKTVLAEGMAGENELKLDIRNLPEGIYFAQVMLDGTLSSTRRFVISR